MPTWNSGDARPPLPPFNAAGLCPKCGAPNLSVRYLRGASDTQYGSAAYRADPSVFPCMQRRCGVCQFETLEAPLSPSDALLPPVSQADGTSEPTPALFVQWKPVAEDA